MKRKDYIQPKTEIVLINIRHELLIGSIVGVQTNGVDDNDELLFGGEGSPTIDNIWDNAW